MTKAPRVLLGEDDDIVGDMYQTGLEKLGWEVVRARTGAEVIRGATLQRPQLVLLDIHMPGLSGSAVVSALKADRVAALIPVLLLTNEDDQAEEVRSALHKGAREVLLKVTTTPFELSQAMAAVLADTARPASPS